MSNRTTDKEKKFIETKVEDGWTSQRIADHLGLSKKVVDKWRQRIKKRSTGFTNRSSS